MIIFLIVVSAIVGWAAVGGATLGFINGISTGEDPDIDVEIFTVCLWPIVWLIMIAAGSTHLATTIVKRSTRSDGDS